MKKALIATRWGSVLWGSLCLAQEPFAMEDDGHWQKVGTAHRLSQFPRIHEDGRLWFQFQAPRTAQSVSLEIGGARYDMQQDGNGRWNVVIPGTRPGYEKDTDARYPVLYLQHGGGELNSEWTHAGLANFTLDHLIAEGKARPMIVVMNTSFVTRAGQAGQVPRRGGQRGTPSAADGARGARGTARRGGLAGFASAFGDMLIDEVIPDIDASYRTIADQEHRGMAGLSMGGMQTRAITLANQQALNEIGVDNVAYVSPETAHEWQTWRRSFYQFTPLLFRD